MGSFLDKPITDKETHSNCGMLNGQRIPYAFSAMQGWRIDMEDAHTTIVGVQGLPDLALFGVFDGHGGSLVAKHSSTQLLEAMRQTEAWALLTPKNISTAHLENAMRVGFLKLDAEMRQLPQVVNQIDHSGSTAVTTFLTPDSIVVGNCGDSRVILVTSDVVRFGSEDHKPNNPIEQARIEKAGGSVSLRRVNGDLAVSRALGDFMYKRRQDLPAEEQQVSAEPIVTIIPRDAKDQFLVLACDGIWDVMDNDAIASYVLEKMHEGYSLACICEKVIDLCLQKNSRDNMSIVIVALPGAPKTIGTRVLEAAA